MRMLSVVGIRVILVSAVPAGRENSVKEKQMNVQRIPVVMDLYVLMNSMDSGMVDSVRTLLRERVYAVHLLGQVQFFSSIQEETTKFP